MMFVGTWKNSEFKLSDDPRVTVINLSRLFCLLLLFRFTFQTNVMYKFAQLVVIANTFTNEVDICHCIVHLF